jgi:hypothetical protein
MVKNATVDVLYGVTLLLVQIHWEELVESRQRGRERVDWGLTGRMHAGDKLATWTGRKDHVIRRQILH